MISTPLATILDRFTDMDFAQRLAAARKDNSLTQQALADRVGIHVSQLRRYEAGINQPTLNVLHAIAVALSVSIDTLVFGDDDRGPQYPSLRMRMEALDHLDPDEQTAVLAILEGAVLRHHQVRQAAVSSSRNHQSSPARARDRSESRTVSRS